MRRALHAADFTRSPLGAYAVGKSFLVWCTGSDFTGTVVWGHPGESDAGELLQAWQHHFNFCSSADVVSDFSRVTAVDPLAFARLLAFGAEHAQEYDARIRRHALVRPGGFPGATVAGFYPLLAPRFEWRLFTGAAEGFAWLDRSDGAAVCKSIGALVDANLGQELIVAAVRELLAREPALEMSAVAARLGLSERTLQRRLGAVNASFRALAVEARLALAQTLLTSTNDKLEVVARRAGLASASDLARLFRDHVGETPAKYRRRRRPIA